MRSGCILLTLFIVLSISVQAQSGTAATKPKPATATTAAKPATAIADKKADTTKKKMDTIFQPNTGPEAKNGNYWRDENATDRKMFYEAKSIFDPVADYEKIFNLPALSGEVAKSEKGRGKIMVDNSLVPQVFYNNVSIGTIVRLENTLNGKSTYAIVVGRTRNTGGENFLFVVNDKVARGIAMKDFTILQISYYTTGLQR